MSDKKGILTNFVATQTERSKYVMYPYLLSVYGLGAATTYAMIRMVFGHKTWFGKD
ncbi:hypothetical protein F9C07_2226615 [Aspergillus flavus]|uniref:Uncharacterized protein n=1 Tax=Aspergillus flavus (strain ATCC 200026 / FGSC A1120 / IAM 13836 / NRRL 3357 / JCM 12722 / SRRC 167) TaxID=332952 RepID=A0A7U2MG97_ASPFN|nr:hypothetical protein F9C07_2226615 [Aspergillus flavus]